MVVLIVTELRRLVTQIADQQHEVVVVCLAVGEQAAQRLADQASAVPQDAQIGDFVTGRGRARQRQGLVDGVAQLAKRGRARRDMADGWYF